MVVYLKMEGGGWDGWCEDPELSRATKQVMSQLFEEIITIDAEIELLRRHLSCLNSSEHLEVFEIIRQTQQGEERGIDVGGLMGFLQ